MLTIYCDVETTKFFSSPEIAPLPRAQQVAALARFFGVAVTFDAAADHWRTWYGADVPALWDALRGQQIAGWNIVHFDMPLIQEAVRLAGAPDPAGDRWSALDLFAEIRRHTSRWYRLEEIAQANLHRGKSGDGTQAAAWLASGDPELARRAAEYCRLDVELVISLHDLARTWGLVLPPRARDTDLTVYRYWCNADGSAWRLAEDRSDRLAAAVGEL